MGFPSLNCRAALQQVRDLLNAFGKQTGSAVCAPLGASDRNELTSHGIDKLG